MKKRMTVFFIIALALLTTSACSDQRDYTVSVKNADFMCEETAWADFNVPENAVRLFETEFAELKKRDRFSFNDVFCSRFQFELLFSDHGFRVQAIELEAYQLFTDEKTHIKYALHPQTYGGSELHFQASYIDAKKSSLQGIEGCSSLQRLFAVSELRYAHEMFAEYEGAKAIFTLEEALPANAKAYFVENETVTPFEAVKTNEAQGLFFSCGIYQDERCAATLYFCVSA
ncbi:MAG: hypothetical protein KH354_09475 [Clostridiales bacterium]|nr:hypothetical protein [Clostridiales bacterium]